MVSLKLKPHAVRTWFTFSVPMFFSGSSSLFSPPPTFLSFSFSEFAVLYLFVLYYSRRVSIKALSNMPESSNSTTSDGTKRVVSFLPTPLMSTYLLCW